MKRLVSTKDLSQEEWLQYRKQGITGTDVGAITGMNPYISAFQVYQDKITLETQPYDNESMRQGRDLENYVALRFEEEMGVKVRRANAIFQNEEHPIMLADFDRLVVGLQDGKKAGLECKTASPYSSDKWRDGKIPLYYMMQVQHYLAVSCYDCWYIATLILGKEFLINKVERDEELISYLITIEERFWKEYVVKRIIPEPDGSKNYSEMLSKLYAKADKGKIISLFGCNELLNRRKELVDLIKKMKIEQNAIEQKIKSTMQNAVYGVTENYKVSWKSVETTRLDINRLKIDHPDIFKKYCKTNYGRRFTITYDL